MGSEEVISLIPLFLAALVPACLVVAAFTISRGRSRFMTQAAAITTVTLWIAVLAVVARLVMWIIGYDTSAAPSSVWRDVFQLDIVSSAMFLLVSVIAFVVVRYSRSYLAGQRELDRYARALLLTVSAASLLVTSNHLAVLAMAWFVTDVGLHQLLTFFRTRRQAVIVAHKKFLLSRLADACFVGAILIIGTEVGSLRIDVISHFALKNGELTPTLHVATVLLVIGVLLKSAQIPFHGWMQAVMEAPTPVSALLHAGVVNIGGFVMIRLAPLMAHAYIAQGILIGVGLATTIIAALVMSIKVAVKGTLAWSTIGQMGFMLVQCGLGAWHLALMHLLAHSLYKAHTFLSSGSIVQQWRGNHIVHTPHARIWHLMAAMVVVFIAVAPFFLAFWAGTWLLGEHLSSGVLPLAFILGLSFAPMIGRALAAGRRAFTIAALFTLGASFAYFAWHAVFELLAPTLNAGVETSNLKWMIVVSGLGVLFIAQSILQTNPNGRFSAWLQPHLQSGLYIDDWFTRITFRLWPPGFR